MNAAIGVLLLSLVAMNVAVTVWVARTDFLLPNQKLAQTLIVWFVPVLGAVGIAVFLLSNRERPHQRSQHIPQEEDDWLGGSGRPGQDGD